mmetsp:Transcript_18707/g.44703  ORF Transcript_18707/g.44703 Transcript_18707/m.44703 type:complete len:541 (-) Transcript_18707:23-1645(-)
MQNSRNKVIAAVAVAATVLLAATYMRQGPFEADPENLQWMTNMENQPNTLWGEPETDWKRYLQSTSDTYGYGYDYYGTETPEPTPEVDDGISGGGLDEKVTEAANAAVEALTRPTADIFQDLSNNTEYREELRSNGFPQEWLDYLQRDEVEQDVENLKQQIGSSNDTATQIRALKTLAVNNKNIVAVFLALSRNIRYSTIIIFLPVDTPGSSIAGSRANADDGRRRLLDVTEPGKLLFDLSEASLSRDTITAILLELQRIASRDKSEFSKLNETEREAAVTEAIGEMLVNKSVINSTEPANVTDPVVDGNFTVGIYYPSEGFRLAYSKKLASAVPTDQDRVLVSSLFVVDNPTINDDIYVMSIVELQEGRCYICDKRNQESSETDSESSSPVSSNARNSEESSEQLDFLANPEVCQVTGSVLFGGFSYEIFFTQAGVDMPCDTCGQFLPTCPNHNDQLEAFNDDLAILRSFVGDNAVETSKTLGGDNAERLISRFSVPNKKVHYEKFGRPATSADYGTRIFTVEEAEVKIPIRLQAAPSA